MLGLAGASAIDSKAAGLTVSTVVPATPPSVAEIVDVPVLSAVATPVAEMLATAGVAEAQVTWPVRSCVVLSENVPVAVNAAVSPLGTPGLAGATAIDCRTAVLTVNVVAPVTPPNLALMDELPVATPVATP